MRKLGLLLGLGIVLAAGNAQAIAIANNDLVVVLQRAGNEYILNIGGAGGAHTIDLSAAATALGGLEGAKFVALGVPEPGRLTPDFGFGNLPQENILFSSLSAPSGLTDQAIELAMGTTDTAAASTAWFWLLRSVSNPLVPTSASFSYQNQLGLGTDAIGNNFPFSIAGTITGGALSIDIFSAVRGYGDFGGPATQVGLIGNISISGNSLNYTVVPEPGTLFLVTAGLAGLARFGRRRALAA